MFTAADRTNDRMNNGSKGCYCKITEICICYEANGKCFVQSDLNFSVADRLNITILTSVFFRNFDLINLQ